MKDKRLADMEKIGPANAKTLIVRVENLVGRKKLIDVETLADVKDFVVIYYIHQY